MIKSVSVTILAAALFTSCSTSTPPVDPAAPRSIAEKRASIPWWRQLNDSSLNKDVEAALSANPNLRSVALRINQADAAVANARAASLPSLNLNFGYQEGRRNEIDSETYDLAPWHSSAGFAWEIDVTGKLRAAQKSASESRNAALWDYHSARLLLTSRIASVRMNLYRFNAEIANLGEALSANKRTLDSLTERSSAGLIPDSILDKQSAEDERLQRTRLELKRLRDITIVQLRTLRGGTNPRGTQQSQLPSPQKISTKPLDQLLASHPAILAAEARVRSAFQLQRSAQLSLLPSFRINLLASGAQQSLTERFQSWTAQAGPSLDIPIYDPARIALVKSRQAKAQIAAAEYRETVLNVLEEIDTARINLASRRAQLASAKRETQSLARSRKNAREQFDAGLTSQIEYLDTERRWLDALRSQSALGQAMLDAHINLIKATGGARL